MKISDMIAKRDALTSEANALLAKDGMTVTEEARSSEIANELDMIDANIRAANQRERFASRSAVSKVAQESRDASERATEWRASTEYRDQFIGYLKGGRAPEQRRGDLVAEKAPRGGLARRERGRAREGADGAPPVAADAAVL